MYEIIPVYRLDGSICYYNIQESYDEETVVSAELTKKQAEAILIILDDDDGVFDDDLRTLRVRQRKWNRR